MYNIVYLDIEKNDEYEKTISKVLDKCFEIEKLPKDKLLVSITLTNPENIKNINNQYRNINKPTDVLSFPNVEYDEPGNFDVFKGNQRNDILNPDTGKIEGKGTVKYGNTTIETVINEDGVVKYLRKVLLNEYMENGWSLGRTGYKPRKNGQGKKIK